MIGTHPPHERTLSLTDYKHSMAFLIIHLSCLLVFITGYSGVALLVGILSYTVRMFGITAGYHRYFSHRTYQTSRLFQFILAFIGASAAQMGPLWWAEHHRRHHAKSDTEDDVHSPTLWGIWWAHAGWIMSKEHSEVKYEHVKDLQKYPELCFIDKHFLFAPILSVAFFYILGVALQFSFPALGTSGLQMLVWGYFMSTVALYHATFAINSLAHLVGSKRFKTGDESRNNFLLALFTFGEGWHNNHHRFPSAEKQGIFWWEIDMTHYILKLFSFFGIVWDLKAHPKHAYINS